MSAKSKQIKDWFSVAKNDGTIKNLQVFRETYNPISKVRFSGYIINKEQLYGEYVLWCEEHSLEPCPNYHFFLVLHNLFKYKGLRTNDKDGTRSYFLVPEEPF